MKATPGPWHINRDPRRGMEWNVFISSGVHEICFLTHDDERDIDNTCPLTEANARLIAAAPELLEACKIAHDMVKNCPGNWENGTREMLGTAIAKAGGKS